MTNSRGIELCLASPVFLPARGGAELRFRRYLPGLRGRGVSIRVVTGTLKAKKLSETDISEEWYSRPVGAVLPTEPIDGTSIHRIRLPDKRGWRRSFVFNQAVLRYCKQPGWYPEGSAPVASHLLDIISDNEEG